MYIVLKNMGLPHLTIKSRSRVSLFNDQTVGRSHKKLRHYTQL